MSSIDTSSKAFSPIIDRADTRTILTLDAGGTNFAFSARCGGEPIGSSCTLPSCGENLEQSLGNLVEGFQQVIDSLDNAPSAISFGFPGPADYPNGVVFNVGNLPAYSDGVAIGPLLQDRFGLPIFINNDGDLFAFGEATGGILPLINERLSAAGSSRQYKNLFAVTLGTGLGGGAVINGQLLLGDHSSAAEIWRLPSTSDSQRLAEEEASIRAVRVAYAQEAGIDFASAPEPADIYQIATGSRPGDQEAAKTAFARLGQAVGEAVATATCFFDGVIVMGGGLAGAADLFMPALIEAVTRPLQKGDGDTLPRVPHSVHDLRTEAGLQAFTSPTTRRVTIPGSSRTVDCYLEPQLGIGVSQLGTSQAAALGAYAFAIQQLDNN